VFVRDPKLRCGIAGAACSIGEQRRVADVRGWAVFRSRRSMEGTVEAEAPGYLSRSQAFRCRGLPKTVVTVDLHGAASLRGRVVAKDSSEPIGKVSLGLQYAAGSAHTTTDAQGRFAFESLPGGVSVFLHCLRRGFAPRIVPLDLDGATEREIVLERSARELRLVCLSPELSRVAGSGFTLAARVTAGERLVYSGSLVFRAGLAQETVPYHEEEQLDGRLLLPLGGAVSATAAVVAPEGQPAFARLEFRELAVAALAFRARQGSIRERGLSYATTDTPPVRGLLAVDASGGARFPVAASSHSESSIRFWGASGVSEPVSAASLRDAARSGLPLEVRIGEFGARIEVRVGHCFDVKSIWVEEAAYGRMHPQKRDNTLGILDFQVPSGLYRVVWGRMPLTGFEFRTKQGKRVTIDLTKTGERPASVVGESTPGATVTVWSVKPPEKVRVAQTLAGPNGSFGFEGLPTGRTLIVARVGARRATKEVFLTAGARTDLGTLDLDAAEPNSMRFHYPGGEPLGGVSLVLHGVPRWQNEILRVETDMDGWARVPRTDAPNYLVAWGPGYGYFPATERDIVIPRETGPDLFLPPATWGPAVQVFWLTRTRAGSIWWISLKPSPKEGFALAHLDEPHYFQVNTKKGSSYVLGRPDGTGRIVSQPGRRLRVPRGRFPPEAATYAVSCERLGAMDLAPFERVNHPRRIPEGGIEVHLPARSTFRILTWNGKGDPAGSATVASRMASQEVEFH